MALLIEHLDRRVVTPLAICPGPGELTDHLRALDCPVAHVPLYPIKPRTLGRVWASTRRIRALIRAERVDVIAPDAPRDALTCGLAALRTPAKLVWFVRWTGPDRLDPLLERLADGMIGDSADVRRRFSHSARVSAKFRAILGGVDLHRFRPADDRDGVRARLGLPRDRCIVLFAGQVTHAKGVLDVVEALGLLRAALPEDRMPLLLVVGTASPAAIVDEIAERAAAGRVAAHVRVIPHQPNIEQWMQAADVLVSGSRQDTEGMSRVLYEAMACGAVAVATNIRGNRDAVTPDTGMLVAERAPAELARALRSLVTDDARRARMRAQGVRRAREVFDIAAHARAVERFYLDLVAERGRAPSGTAP